MNRKRKGTVVVQLVGGPCDGQQVELDPRDVTSRILVAPARDGRAVALTVDMAKQDREAAGDGAKSGAEWTPYWLWPRTDPGEPVQYRFERPGPDSVSLPQAATADDRQAATGQRGWTGAQFT